MKIIIKLLLINIFLIAGYSGDLLCMKNTRDKTEKRRRKKKKKKIKYTCKYCDASFQNKEAVDNHKKNYCKKRPKKKKKVLFTCKYCDSTDFLTQYALNNHEKKYCKKRPKKKKKVLFTCKYCSSTDFSTQFAINNHEKNHCKKRPKEKKKVLFTCKYCGSTDFLTPFALNNHKTNHCKKRPPKKKKVKYTCEYCEATFQNKDALNNHKTNHCKKRPKKKKKKLIIKLRKRKAKPITVESSSEEESSSESESSSEDAAYSENESLQDARLPIATYPLRSRRRREARVDRQDDMSGEALAKTDREQEVPCQYCNEFFEDEDDLRLHVNNICVSSPIVQAKTCSYCKNVLKSKEEVMLHIIKFLEKGTFCNNKRVKLKRIFKALDGSNINIFEFKDEKKLLCCYGTNKIYKIIDCKGSLLDNYLALMLEDESVVLFDNENRKQLRISDFQSGFAKNVDQFHFFSSKDESCFIFSFKQNSLSNFVHLDRLQNKMKNFVATSLSMKKDKRYAAVTLKDGELLLLDKSTRSLIKKFNNVAWYQLVEKVVDKEISCLLIFGHDDHNLNVFDVSKGKYLINNFNHVYKYDCFHDLKYLAVGFGYKNDQEIVNRTVIKIFDLVNYYHNVDDIEEIVGMHYDRPLDFTFDYNYDSAVIKLSQEKGLLEKATIIRNFLPVLACNNFFIEKDDTNYFSVDYKYRDNFCYGYKKDKNNPKNIFIKFGDKNYLNNLEVMKTGEKRDRDNNAALRQAQDDRERVKKKRKIS